jgi:Zn-dependent protease/predicted transcriptional regulator
VAARNDIGGAARSDIGGAASNDLDSGLGIGRILGIPVYLHPTWFVVFVLVMVALWNHLALEHPELSPAGRIVAALFTSALVFGSILVHELGHCVLALRHGVAVRSIVLFVFGGVAWMEAEARTPRAELEIALAGPTVSAGLGLLFLGLAVPFAPASSGESTFQSLGFLNVAVALFNLLPGFPLDGGRVLHAALWAAGRDPARATRTAARVGLAIAYGLVGLGAALAWNEPLRGIWLAFIGWFVLTASIAHRRQAGLELTLRGLLARDLMSANVPTVDASTSVERFADENVLRGDRWAIVLASGQPQGIVSRTDVKALPPDRWPGLTVGEIATPMEQVVMATPDLPAIDLLHLFSQHRTHQIPIMDGSLILGAVTRLDLLQALEAARPDPGARP